MTLKDILIWNRPAILDGMLHPNTWLSVGVVLKPKMATMDNAIIAHEMVHIREQWAMGALVAFGLSWVMPGPFMGILTGLLVGLVGGIVAWLLLWLWCRPFRLSAEVRGIRKELEHTPKEDRYRVALAYAKALCGPSYRWAARNTSQAMDLLLK